MATYDYQLPEWFRQDYTSKLSAANAARDAWGPALSARYSTIPGPAQMTPQAEFGYLIPRAMSQVAAGLQGLFQGRALNPGFGDLANTGWRSWGESGPGFEGKQTFNVGYPGYFTGHAVPEASRGVIQPGKASDPNRALSPALYDYPDGPYINSPDAASSFAAPDANAQGQWDSGVSGKGQGSYQLRPGEDGYWWNNVWDAADRNSTKGIDAAYADALQQIKLNLARKGTFDPGNVKQYTRELDRDKGRLRGSDYGNQAVEYFRNLIDQDLASWTSNLGTDWARTNAGKAPRWLNVVEPIDTRYVDREGKPNPLVQRGTTTSKTLDPSFFGSLAGQARQNYTQALQFANTLHPDLSNAFLASINASEQGSAETKAGKGWGEPTAYFPEGQLQRPGGIQEYLPTQEFANQFPQNQRDFSGSRSR